MATSIHDLITLLQQESSCTTGEDRQDAVIALHPLVRAVQRLTMDGLEPSIDGAREAHARELADACAASASVITSTPDAPGPITDLAGALSDLVGVLRDELGREQRWAVVTELAETVRVLTVEASDDPTIPPAADLRWTHRAARTICIAALGDPSAPRARAILDRAVPGIVAEAGSTPIQVAAESLIVISDRLRRATTGRHPPPTLVEVFAVTRAAESIARTGASMLADVRDQPTNRPIPAAEAWRAVRVSLAPFTGAARADTTGTPPDDLTRWALDGHLKLREELGPSGMCFDAMTSVAVVHLQRMLHELPQLADHVDAAVTELADRGDLHASAGRLGYRPDRLADYLRNRPVVADRFDVTDTHRELAYAATVTAALAVELTGAAGGNPQAPNLIAANTARAEPLATAATEWAALARSIDPALLEDPSWPRLAATMEQAQDAGFRIAAEVIRLAGQTHLDHRRPAADLFCRLTNEIPAMQTPLPPDGYRTTDTPARSPHPPATAEPSMPNALRR